MGQTPNNPYTAPITNAEVKASDNLSGPYGKFRNNGTLKTILVSLLVIDALLSIINTGILNYMDIQQYEDASYLATDDLSELDGIITTFSLSHAALSIVLIVIFSVWINRSCKNAWLLDPSRMTFTPGWAVGYFFIPILMLWKPYGAIKEIRSASYGKDHPLKALMPMWWTLWLISNFISNYTFRQYSSDDIDDYLTACKIDLIATPVNVILSFLAIALVTGITLAQQRRLGN